MLMSRFSDEHKRAEQLVRQQTSRLDTDNPFEENLHEVLLPKSVEVPELPEMVAKVEELLAQTGLDVYLLQKEAELNEKRAKVKNLIAIVCK